MQEKRDELKKLQKKNQYFTEEENKEFEDLEEEYDRYDLVINKMRFRVVSFHKVFM